MNETLPENINKKFVAESMTLDRKTLLEKIYRQRQPAIYSKRIYAEFLY